MSGGDSEKVFEFYGAEYPAPEYNPVLDLNQDTVISGGDSEKVFENYGLDYLSYPETVDFES